MKKILLLLPLLILLVTTCNSVEPPGGLEINLKLEDVSCTEAWITLTTSNLQLPATVTLKQDGVTRETINVETKDTLLYIDSLLPNQTYNLLATMQQTSNASNELTVTTMDTTSHNFSWQVFTFGEHGHSRLNDVAIVGEEIWAVGAIYMNDTLGQQDPNAYNAVHWDGNHWELKRVMFYTFCGQSSQDSYPASSIITFSESDVWIAIKGDQLAKIENGVQTETICMPWIFSINKIWGISSNNLYVVGNNGKIAHYQDGSWSSIESGTEVDLHDVWGDNEGTIWTCGYSDNYGTTALLRYTDEQWETVYEGNSSDQNNGYYIGPINGVWAANNYRIYMMNWGGIYIQANSSNLFLEKEIAKFSDVGFGIDGADDNNIFACGEGFVGHFNGISYTEYPELYSVQRTFYEVSIKGNVVCAVGSDYNGPIYSQAVMALSK